MFKLFQLLRNADPEAAGGAPAGTPPATQNPPAVETPPQSTPPAAEQPKYNVTYKDPATKQVADMLGKANLDPVKVNEVVKGNGGALTPEIYGALMETHGEGMANLIAGQMTTMYNEAVERGNAQRKEIFGIVEEAFKGLTDQGGEATFGELNQWAAENVPNDERKKINELIEKGGYGAQLAVNTLINKFKASSDYSQDMVGVQGDTTAPTGGGSGISRAEYNTELAKLRNAGEDYNTSPKIKALQARRERGIRQGI